MKKRILIIRQDRIGDVVLTTPLINSLRSSFPDAFISVMVKAYTKEILINNPQVNNIIIYDENNSFWQTVNEIKKYKFDTALLILPNERLSWILFFANIPDRYTTGWKPYQALTFMKTISRHKYIPLRHEADYCLDFARRLGAKSNDLTPRIYLTEEEKLIAEKLIPKINNEIVIGLNQTSGRSAPNWSIENYIKLAKNIFESFPNSKIFINLSKDITFENYFSALEKKRIFPVNHLTIREYIIHISRFDLMISSSTGPMHIAAALNVPTLSLFCPITACSPKLWGPLGNVSKVILPPDNYCKTKCPGDPLHCSFEGGIEVQQILEQIQLYFKKKN